MDTKVLKSERLLLKPLSYYELSSISKNEIDNIETIIEPEGQFILVEY